MRCRTGSLRGRRSLRDLYIGFALGLPMVGVEIFSIATNGSANPKGITHHEVIAPRVVGPAVRPLSTSQCYFLSSGETSVRTFFATILLPLAVAWVLSACIMPSTPKTPFSRKGKRGTWYFFASRE
jgi:hypothetical protein